MIRIILAFMMCLKQWQVIVFFFCRLLTIGMSKLIFGDGLIKSFCLWLLSLRWHHIFL